MKKFLPILFGFLSLGFLFLVGSVSAQTTPAPGQQMQQNGEVPSGSWVIDPEVTFIGKNAARSGNLLDFTLQNYNWVCVSRNTNGQCVDTNNPLLAVWQTTILYIVTPFLLVIILVASMVIIITRGRSLTITRFLPRFVGVLLLIFISFYLLRYFYIFADVIQGFFLRSNPNFFGGNPCPPDCISQRDLLYVGWDYKSFVGLRLLGDVNTESAFVSLLLTKLTALTYYVMVGILYLRRIILWLFIIVSPIFPLLLMFYPIRNTGKIWIGEFFRWLLYAPLFAIFLKGLVSLWRNQIPLVFSNPDIGEASKVIYPTAVNILLGGPKQFVTPTNSINLTETFALYVVSLIMLWGVIILPWILLQIFLDYAQNMNIADNAAMKKMVNMISNRQGPPPVAPGHPPSPGGATISLPFTKKFNLPVAPPAPTGLAREIPTSVGESKFAKSVYMPTAQVKAQVLSMTNMSLPTMRDIAKYDTSLISRDSDKQKEVTVIRENLEKIANPSTITSTTEREKFTEIREKLSTESKSGNTLATSIINAANTVSKRSAQANTTQLKNILTQIANPTSATSSSSSASSSSISSSVLNKSKIENMNKSLTQAKKEGSTLAASILAVNDKTSVMEIEKLSEKIRDARMKGDPIGLQIGEIAKTEDASRLPVVNRVQTVSKDDYEAVKSMWKENYKNLEVPEGMSGTRAEWIKEDMTKIENIISLLSSNDEEKVKQGMDEVSSILPFLLVGGFSQTEIVAYLKAKQDAAKEVAAEIIQDEDDKVSVNVNKTQTATQIMTATMVDEDEESDSSLSSISTSASSSLILDKASQEILSLINIKLPKISDIARYETLSMRKDKSKATEADEMHEVFKNIANPENVKNAADRERYEKLKEKLVAESAKGNIISQAVLSAASGTKGLGVEAASNEAKTVLSQIANPSLAAKPIDKERFTSLHDQLTKAGMQGNTLANSLLSFKENATKEEIDALTQKLNEEKTKGDSLAQSVLSNITSPASLPTTNRIQTVNQSDYQAVKEMWKDNYKNLEVPSELAGNRPEWIKDDISKIGNIVNLLSSSDPQKAAQGMDEVSSILPFLLVGGFSQSEIVSYLQAKQDAAKESLITISQDEDALVNVDRKQTQAKQIMTASQDVVVAPTGYDMSQPSAIKKVVNPQISEEILKLANIELPSLKDIARYETRDLTKDKTESERIEQIHQVLERINNPTSIVSVSEREKYESLAARLNEESQKGNATADVILSAVSQLNRTASQINATLADVKQVLFQIVNAPSITEVDDRDYYTRLHDYLEKESKEKNNTLATKVLSINEQTKIQEIRDIKNQLTVTGQAGNTPLPQLNGAINGYTRSKQLRSVIKQIIAPDKIASSTDRENFAKLHDSLNKESAKGNNLAATLLSVTDKTSDEVIKQLHDKLVEESQKGEVLASTVLSQVSAPSGISATSRLQAVKPEEYEEVRELWQKAYKQYLVPPEFTEDTKGRSEWINKDITEIEQTINLLNSTDPEKKNEGVEKVSSILPFLLLGGYSFNEINGYLKVKLEAAQYALKDVQTDEESKISVDVKKKISTSQTLSATVPDESGIPNDVTSNPQSVKSTISPQVTNDILNLVNIKLPTMSDIAKYEVLSMSKDKSKTVEIERVRESLSKITDPSVISTDLERDKFQKLQGRLILESQAQNVIAESILNAAFAVSQKTFNASAQQIKNVFSQVVNPATTATDIDRKRLEELRKMLDKDARENSNKLAQAILSVNEKTTIPEMEKIREDLRKGQVEGNRLANNIIWTINKCISGTQTTEKAKKMFTQIANPALVTDPTERNKFAKVHDVLLKASLSGNHLANSILSVSDKSTNAEIDRILGEVKTGKVVNDPAALEITSLVDLSVPVSLPSINKVQTVGNTDYDSVKEIWKESYRTLDIPEGNDNNRADWIKEDIENIDIIMSNLNSQDKEQVEKGMDEVSNILPFVLVGGFSQGEINSYLKAKQEAAKETLEVLSKDEEEKLEVSPKKDEKQKEMESVKEEIPNTEKKK